MLLFVQEKVVGVDVVAAGEGGSRWGLPVPGDVVLVRRPVAALGWMPGATGAALLFSDPATGATTAGVVHGRASEWIIQDEVDFQPLIFQVPRFNVCVDVPPATGSASAPPASRYVVHARAVRGTPLAVLWPPAHAALLPQQRSHGAPPRPPTIS